MADGDRKRALAVLGAAAVIGALIAARQCPSETDDAPDRATGDDAHEQRATAPPLPDRQPPRLPPDRVPPARQGPPPENPIIDEIIVEKPEVCAGEQNLITVKAHTPGNRDDAYLKYLIGSDAGQSVPIRTYLPDADEEQEPRKITVFGRLGTRTDVDIPPFVVKDCSPARQLFIGFRALPNTLDEFEFVAQIRDMTAMKPMQPPFRFEWDFGDGTTAETDVPLVEHNYENRSFDTLVSQMLIRCKVTDANGETLIGLRSLQIENDSFEQFAFKGLIYLRTLNSPRFPVMDANGRVSQTTRVWHMHDQPVTVEKVYRTRYPEGGVPPEPADSIDPASFLGRRIIAPGQKVEVELDFDTMEHDRIAYELYELRGTSADGWPAHGSISIMKPPKMPTREQNQPVTDPLFAAKILAAREILGQEFVTDEDIWRLEKSGAFEDLEPVDNLTTSGTPPPLPKPPEPPRR